jgi:hypothetical protein
VNASYAALALVVVYALVGVGMAWLLSRRTVDRSTSLGAIVCWPLLLPLLSTTSPGGAGPLAARIDDCIEALHDTLGDPAAAPMDGPEDLEGLTAALYRADERLALVDRLLGSLGQSGGGRAGLAQSLAQLQQARAAAVAEVEAVLEGLDQLRVQIALRSLAGNSVPVRERLRDLRARLVAADELAALELRNDYP